MILYPQPASVGDEEWGWFVLQEACLRYREAYPEGVECFDYEWARL